MEFVLNNGLEQLIKELARNDAILDVVFGDNHAAIAMIDIIDLFSTSDNSMMYFNLMITQSHHSGHQQQQLPEINFARAD